MEGKAGELLHPVLRQLPLLEPLALFIDPAAKRRVLRVVARDLAVTMGSLEKGDSAVRQRRGREEGHRWEGSNRERV